MYISIVPAASDSGAVRVSAALKTLSTSAVTDLRVASRATHAGVSANTPAAELSCLAVSSVSGASGSPASSAASSLVVSATLLA